MEIAGFEDKWAKEELLGFKMSINLIYLLT
jgi:hypothetical protein